MSTPAPVLPRPTDGTSRTTEPSPAVADPGDIRPTFAVTDDVLARLVGVAAAAGANRSAEHRMLQLTADADSGTVTARISGEEVSLELTADATVSDAGTVVVPADSFAALKSFKTADTVTFAPSGAGKVAVTSGRRRGKLAAVKLDVAALMPADGVTVTVDADRLVGVLSGLTKATAGKATAVLGSVNLTVADGTLTAVTTDSYRMWARTAPVGAADRAADARIHADTIDKCVLPVLKDLTGQVKVTFTERTVQLRGDGTALEVHTIAGDYPKWEPLVAKVTEKTPTTLTVRIDALETELAQALVFRDSSKTPAVTLTIDPDGQDTLLVTVDDDQGTCPVDATVAGNGLAMHCNAQFLQEALGACKATGTAAVFGISDPLKPFSIRSADIDADGTVTINDATKVMQTPRRPD